MRSSARLQPPPRGCVLKLYPPRLARGSPNAAASARLCVETKEANSNKFFYQAAASARLCVETVNQALTATVERAAASARLCVETESFKTLSFIYHLQPPPRGCVLKQ